MDNIRQCTSRFEASNMETVPSTKVANTIWQSHENVAWEIGAELIGNHCKCKTDDIFSYVLQKNPQTIPSPLIQKHHREEVQNKPALDNLDPRLHILLDESHVQEGSVYGPYETGCMCQMLPEPLPHQESARICMSVFPIRQHPTL